MASTNGNRKKRKDGTMDEECVDDLDGDATQKRHKGNGM